MESHVVRGGKTTNNVDKKKKRNNDEYINAIQRLNTKHEYAKAAIQRLHCVSNNISSVYISLHQLLRCVWAEQNGCRIHKEFKPTAGSCVIWDITAGCKSSSRVETWDRMLWLFPHWASIGICFTGIVNCCCKPEGHDTIHPNVKNCNRVLVTV